MQSSVQTGQVIICHCLQVTESEIRDAITIRGCCSLNDIRQCTGAGTGCTACHRRIYELLCEENVSAAPLAGENGELVQTQLAGEFAA